MRTQPISRYLFASILLPCAAAVSVTTALADYPSTILADNPVAYFRLEETTGADVYDSSTNGFIGVIDFNSINSPTLGLPGIDTNSFSFAYGPGGAGDYGQIDVPFNVLLAPPAADAVHGAAFSAEVWLQPTTQPASGSYCVPLADNGPYGSGSYSGSSGWNIYQSPGPASFWIFDMRPNSFQQFTTPIVLLEWYHLAVTYSGSVFTYYINGVSQGAFADATYIANPGYDLYVGSGPNTGWQPFQGGVDEVALYDYELTAAQIANHYQVGTNSFRAVPTPASIVSEPASITNYSGTTATFSATGNGTTPLYYQWYRGTSAIAGATGTSYSFTSQYAADNGATFTVVITNAYGAVTSSVATLTVLTNVNLVAAPGSITREVGSHAAFRVVANGALPVSYAWSVSTDSGATFTAIPGQTADTLWLTNVQLSQNGYEYAVAVSNPFTATTNSATLSVEPRLVTVPLTGYAAIVAADQPVAYWRLDETNSTTATDAVGSFDGTYTNGTSGSFIFGAASGIPNTTDAAVGMTNGATIQIPYAPELNSDTAWSIETWLNPAIIDTYRVVLSSEYNLYPNPYNGWYCYLQPSANFAFVPQPGNAFITANPVDPANNNLLVVGKWYHLAITDDGTTFTVYINGVAISGYPVASSDFIPNGTGINLDGTAGITAGLGNTVLGARTDGAFGTFEGTMDDTAVYNYALSAAQVQTHFLNQVKLTITASGTSVILSWPYGTLQSSTSLSGPWAAVSGATAPYTTSATGAQVFYRVQTQ